MTNHANIPGALPRQLRPPIALEDVKDATEVVFSTSVEEIDARRKAMEILEAANMYCTPEEYADFYTRGVTLSPAEVSEAVRRQPILHFYETAFEKVKREIRDLPIAPGTAVMWLVYNMGYVVKTETTCFAMDLHHRRSEELVPWLDFLLITHDHSDHYTPRLLDAFARSGKPVISNFYPQKITSTEPRTMTVGTATIRTCTTDHNRRLTNFVQPCEIELDTAAGKLTVFTGGDSCAPSQFVIHNSDIDVFVVHPRVGLDVAEAQRIVNPKLTLISHLLEMGHRFDQWRWGYEVGLDELERSRINGRACAMPLWGDRIAIKQTR